jgi:hypothetical protein
LCEDVGGEGSGAGLAVFLVFLALGGIGAGGWVYYRKKRRQPLLPDCRRILRLPNTTTPPLSRYIAVP